MARPENFLQGGGVQGLDVGLVHETSEAGGSVCSHKHSQTPDQQTLDLHSVTLAELKLVWSRRTVVSDGDTGARH